MFYYYGRKKQIVRHYPAPNFDKIVEPFAGSAAYALHGSNWKKEVWLIEKDPRVAGIWDWLINEAKPEKILSLPNLRVGEKSSEFLHIIHAATKMAFKYKTIKVTPVLERNWEISKRVMASSVHKVKNWKIVCGDYQDAPKVEATWFIDPPYRGAPGMGYEFGSDRINYNELARWVEKLFGEAIVCEGQYGDYLPFQPLLRLPGVAGKLSTEKLYYRSTEQLPQLDLFGHASEVQAQAQAA